jgi:leucyl aminopeptidase
MQYTTKSDQNLATLKTDCLVALIFDGDGAKKASQELGTAITGIVKSLLTSGDLTTNIGSSSTVINPAGIQATRLLLIAAGPRKEWGQDNLTKVLNSLCRTLNTLPIKNASIAYPVASYAAGNSSAATQISQELIGSQYRYSKTISRKVSKPSLAKVEIVCSGKASSDIKAGLKLGRAIGNGINVAKELGNLPANICTPTYLANQAKAMAKKCPLLNTKILEEKQMKELGMGSLLSVSAGSVQPAKFVIMEYKGAKDKKQAPKVLVGKGVTFDTGGISLKPGAKMDEMKYDMCGAASVIGTMTTIIEAKAAINVIGIVAAVENMPSGIATKPGDVVTSMAGLTIEVLNTDAEGRLVLADALTYVERYKPSAVIDIATLTGACVVALGHVNSGLYTNHQPLADKLLAAGNDNGDYVWQMPLNDAYQKQIDSPFADIANIGGPGAGSVTAACFLSRFTKKYNWAHLDIAGTAWNSGANKSATGRPVALLTHYLLAK